MYGLFLLVRTVRVVRGSWNLKGVAVVIVVILTAKDFIVCFSVFILFAVHVSKTACPLYFRRENNRETHENRESYYSLLLCVRVVRVVRGLSF